MRISDWSSDVCSSDLVNRVPVDGTITALAYRPGKFVNAALDKASEDNERMALKVTNYDGVDVGFVQIAGLVARRIVCAVKLDEPVRAGQPFDLIRFDSRPDVYLPDGVAPLGVPVRRNTQEGGVGKQG